MMKDGARWGMAFGSSHSTFRGPQLADGGRRGQWCCLPGVYLGTWWDMGGSRIQSQNVKGLQGQRAKALTCKQRAAGHSCIPAIGLCLLSAGSVPGPRSWLVNEALKIPASEQLTYFTAVKRQGVDNKQNK